MSLLCYDASSVVMGMESQMDEEKQNSHISLSVSVFSIEASLVVL